MTIESSAPRKAGPFPGDGLNTAFDFTFKVFATSDVVATFTDSLGNESTLVENSDYTVELNPDQDTNPGGTVTYPNPAADPPIANLAADERLTLSSDIPGTQGTQLPNAGGWYPKIVEAALDKLTALIQQLSESSSRALRYPISDDSVSAEMPTVTQRKGKVLAFDATTGAPVAQANVPTSGVAATAYAETLLDDANATEARATLDTYSTAETDAADAAVALAAWSTGDAKLTLKAVADAGWVMFDDGTLGDASSSATTRANADTEALFTLLWNNTADADCPVSSGRGASAAADFAAHKTITLPQSLGRALAVAGAGSGLTSRALAEALGDENMQQHDHTGTTGNDSPDHTHANGAINSKGTGAGLTTPGTNQCDASENQQTGGASVRHQHAFTTDMTGTGASGNMQPSVFLNVMVKL